jgi:4-fold beta flower protein
VRVIYGREGQPAGSVEDSELYDRDGKQIGLLDGEHIYSVPEGEWLGSYSFGVVRNVVGDPVGFSKGCENSIPPLPPRLRSMLPPRLISVGVSVRDEAAAKIPSFLSHMSSIVPPPAHAGFFQ